MKINWELWEVFKEQQKNYGCGYASNYMDKQSDMINSSVYHRWLRIMLVCKSIFKENHTKIEFDICNSWLDFSNFKKWYDENYYELENEDVGVYATLLDFSNREYSPQNTVIAPRSIGFLLHDGNKYQENTRKYNLPKWVTINIKEGCKNSGFGGQISFGFKGGKRKNIYVNSKKKAYDAFWLCKFYKELSFVHIAHQYKDVIEKKLFDTIIRYRADDMGEYYIDEKLSNIYLYGIGYIDVTNFSQVTYEEITSDSFREWENMVYQTYQGKTLICEEWKDYFKFRAWWKNAEYRNISDKHKVFNTLYSKNNICYSEETTVLLPYNIYKLVYKQGEAYMYKNENYPTGITKRYLKEKEMYYIVPPIIDKDDKKKYSAKYELHKGYINIEEAQIAYKNFREGYKKEYLNDGGYIKLLNPKLFKALLDYEIDIPTAEMEEDEDKETDYIEC